MHKKKFMCIGCDWKGNTPQVASSTLIEGVCPKCGCLVVRSENLKEAEINNE